ncbi:hypothetical protein C900_01506 [Fulvivirga imtechensis AK7]|uniref:Uncharacterized protein n=1 Tax=Fulvivirga imtechensis AK7 TaxID=1237149 RepID=L8JIA1_9BACT|nr:hypothetical protein C900_01506 [Fulvivirga imtechensis AK7]
MLWDKYGGNLFTGHVATVVKVARLIHRLKYGTREVLLRCWLLSNLPPVEWGNNKEEYLKA